MFVNFLKQKVKKLLHILSSYCFGALPVGVSSVCLFSCHLHEGNVPISSFHVFVKKASVLLLETWFTTVNLMSWFASKQTYNIVNCVCNCYLIFEEHKDVFVFCFQIFFFLILFQKNSFGLDSMKWETAQVWFVWLRPSED